MKLYAVAVPIALIAVAGVTYRVHSQLTPKPLKSFVVTSVMSSPRAGSPYPHTSTFLRAVRADGSWVESWTRNIGGKETYERMIHDYQGGMYTIVEDQTKSIVRSTIPEDEYKHRLAAAITCQGNPSGKILGVDVNEFDDAYQITENPQGAATAVVKMWLAPELGCFEMQKETIWTRNSDGVLLVDTKVTPIDITFQSVDQYFELPTTAYTERTKEEAFALLQQAVANAGRAGGH
jgi:hypothetical protein